MPTNLLSIISYVLISTFTPGPSNISSASMAVIHGYKKTINFQIGLALGVFCLMAISGLFSATLMNVFPSIEPVLRYVGAAYILYLAFVVLKASYSISNESVKPLGISKGFMLQVLNPKLTVYAFTLFSGFLVSISMSTTLMLFAAVLLAATSFCATSLWALFGTAIQTYLRHPRTRIVVNVALSLSLVYAALSLIGIV
jgi:cysteine/O-acetylserine efflux protein